MRPVVQIKNFLEGHFKSRALFCFTKTTIFRTSASSVENTINFGYDVKRSEIACWDELEGLFLSPRLPLSETQQ